MKLLSPPGRDSRPIIDRVKESLFSVLQKYDLPADKTVADLFAGVGSLGLEALSRGARFVTFVESNPKIVLVLEQNITKAGFGGQSRVIRTDAFNVDLSADLVFVDPPYVDSKETQAGSPLAILLTRLGDSASAGGYIIVRTHQDTTLPEAYGTLKIIERRQWGNMAVTILRKAKTDD